MVIGMEVHAQVTSQAKLFSGASTEFGGEANSHVSLVDAAMPGHAAGDQCRMRAPGGAHRARSQCADQPEIGIRPQKLFLSGSAGTAIRSASTNRRSWARARLSSTCRTARRCGSASSGCISNRTPANCCTSKIPTMSLVDLNRSGVALMEIVSKPDLRSADEAKAFLTKLRSVLRYLGTCDGDMEKGNLRADVNVSVRKPGAPLGTRCEIKNVNSIRFIGQAIEHEAGRQIAIIEDGGTIEQETRLFDPDQGRNAIDANARKKRTTIATSPIRICCRSNFRRRWLRICRRACRNCRTRRRRASCGSTRSRLTTRMFSSPNAKRQITSKRSPRAATPRRRRIG